MTIRFGDEMGRHSLPEVGRARAAFVARGGVGAVLAELEERAADGGLRVVAIR